MKRPRKVIPLQIESIEFSTAPYDGPIAVEQRLRNLMELAIAIGRKEGLLGNHEKIEVTNREGGQNVTDKGNIRDCEASPPGQDKAGDQKGE